MTTQSLDTTKATAFQARMVEILNSSFLGLGMGIGHHLGLFDMMAGRDWATSTEPHRRLAWTSAMFASGLRRWW
jgi:hypothetical protein